MFSSLLPRPKHSNYNPQLHYRIHSQSTPSNNTSQALVLHDESSTIVTNNKLDNSYRTSASDSTKTYDATIPLKVRFPNLVHDFPRPPPDTAVIEETRNILTALLEAKLGTQRKEQTTYINYTDNASTQLTIRGNAENTISPLTTSSVAEAHDDSSGGDGDGDGRIIQIETMQEDPLLPPKHKLRKNRHERHDQEREVGPILKKSAKVTKEDRQKWNIPAAISNWKNNSGFTISLEKRVIGAAAGSEASASVGSEGGSSLNIEKFSALNQALNQAEVKAREDITRRNELRQQLEMNEQRSREEKIREIASRSRQRRY
ncbi:PRP45 [Candida theae]|uniref:Pre-mRNA-processing protein 45 n=1 Tax=Candida theae TaxID=1198502 RepID=A0AAD5G088_9ASCO|nr:PRP45 [Candida theae]KAI5964436.1 PRP45 [Candida theae]